MNVNFPKLNRIELPQKTQQQQQVEPQQQQQQLRTHWKNKELEIDA